MTMIPGGEPAPQVEDPIAAALAATAATEEAAKIPAAPVVEPVAAVPAPQVPDISPAEFAAGVRNLEQAMAVAWASREQTAKQLIEQVPDDDIKAKQLQQLELEKVQWQLAQAQIPQQLQQRHAALQEISTRTGVPVKLLATAKTESDIVTIIDAWGNRPQAAAPNQGAPSQQAVLPQADPVQPVAQKVDSAVNTGAGGAGQESWRSLSAADKIAYALRSK